MHAVLFNSSVKDLARKHCSKGSRLSSHALENEHARCCETARLSVRSNHYPIKLLVFHYEIYYLVMLISEGMTRSRNARSQALRTKFTRIGFFLLGNVFKYAVFCRK